MAVAIDAQVEFNDDDLALLATFPAGSVQYLMVGGTQVTLDGLAQLRDIGGLRKLSFAEGQYDDTLIAHLEPLAGIEHLNLMSVALTDAGLSRLARLPALRELVLDSPAELTHRAYHQLAQMPQLEMLLLRGLDANDVAVDQIARLPQLRHLWIGGHAVTDGAVPRLAEMQSLESLVLLQTSVTPDGRRMLERSLPDCTVDTVS